MKKPPALAAHCAGTISVLSVDPRPDDHPELEAIFNSSPWSFCPGSLWALQTCRSLESAASALHSGWFPILLCERDLRPGTWRDLFELTELLPEPPLMIVTSRVADKRLWAEALNLGAYDVLTKPFDRTEVTRVLSTAWMHWTGQRRPAVDSRLIAARA